MKLKLLSILFLAISVELIAQVAIGKDGAFNESVSLEFGNVPGDSSRQRGLLLPWVTNANDVVDAVPGTFVFDLSDKKVKYYKGGLSSEWTDLSLTTSGIADSSMQDTLDSSSDAKVSIGEPSDTPGILVLEDDNKAMVLPLIDNYKSIENPSPGMIAYDLANNMFCVFNGKEWTFWRATS